MSDDVMCFPEPLASRRVMLQALLESHRPLMSTGLPEIDEDWTLGRMLLSGHTPSVLVRWIEATLGFAPDMPDMDPHWTVRELAARLVDAGHRPL